MTLKRAKSLVSSLDISCFLQIKSGDDLTSCMSPKLQVLGVQSDVLFPVTQQRELESLLKEARMC